MLCEGSGGGVVITNTSFCEIAAPTFLGTSATSTILERAFKPDPMKFGIDKLIDFSVTNAGNRVGIPRQVTTPIAEAAKETVNDARRGNGQ